MAYVIDHRIQVGENLGQVPQTESQGLPTPVAIIGALAILWLVFKIFK